jgi:hypothetical protein
MARRFAAGLYATTTFDFFPLKTPNIIFFAYKMYITIYITKII